MYTYELFDPKCGRTLGVTRTRWMARLLCRLVRNLDYAEINEGWL